jgi:hypothetical protein
MKKTKQFISIFLFSFSCYYSSLFFLNLESDMKVCLDNLKVEFLFQAEKVSKELKRLEIKALEITKNFENSEIHKSLSVEVESLIILDSNKKFRSGYKYKPKTKGGYDKILSYSFDKARLEKWQLYKPLLDDYKAEYLVKYDEKTYFLIVFNISEVSKLISTLSYGYESFAFFQNQKNIDIDNTKTEELNEFFSTFKSKSIHLESMVSDGWYLVFDGKVKDVYKLKKEDIKTVFHLLFLITIFLISIAAIFLNQKIFTATGLWAFSLLFTLSLLIAIYLFLFTYKDLGVFESVRNKNKKISNELISKKDLILIPTCIEIRQIEDSGDIYKIELEIEQSYPIDKRIKTGFSIDKSPNLISSKISKTRCYTSKNEIKIFYNCLIEIKQNFWSRFYPFDENFIELNILPLDTNEKLAFHSELEHCENKNEFRKTTIIKKTLKNWRVEKTYTFSFNSSNGIDFFLLLKRDLKKLTYEKFLPSIIILTLTFFALFIPGSKFKLSYSFYIILVLILIFLMVLEQRSLHFEKSFKEICILDYFYFSYYFTLLITFFISLYSYIKSSKKTMIIFFKSLAIMYWPLFLASLLLSLILFS